MGFNWFPPLTYMNLVTDSTDIRKKLGMSIDGVAQENDFLTEEFYPFIYNQMDSF